MKLPGFNDFQDAVQLPEHSFLDPVLRAGETKFDPRGMPSVTSGGFALTYSVTSGGKRYAVRCFHKPGNNLEERYAAIARFIGSHPELGFLIDVKYLAEGIRVNGLKLPVVRMPWVTGTRLSYWIEDHLDAPGALEKVRGEIAKAVAGMRRAGIAHGDLQHGNILVDGPGKIHLVDYDGMFLPELHVLGATESGHRNYQHPDRVEQYDATLDEFSAFAIDLALDAVTLDKTIWRRFSNDENILFTSKDFAAPSSSRLFEVLRGMPPLADRARRLQTACEAPLGAVPGILSGAASTTPRRTRDLPHRTGLCIGAKDKATLLAHQGDEATVFGRINRVRVLDTARGKMALINFGRYQDADFCYFAYDRAARELIDKFGNQLNGLWKASVSLTGLLTTFTNPKFPDAGPAPQLEIHRAAALQILTPEQFSALEAETGNVTEPPRRQEPVTSPSPAKPPRRARPTSMDQRINDLYGAKYVEPPAKSRKRSAAVTPQQPPGAPTRPQAPTAGTPERNPTPPDPYQQPAATYSHRPVAEPPPSYAPWTPPSHAGTRRRPRLADRLRDWWRRL